MKKSNSCIIYSILLLSILVQIFVNWGYKYIISSESYVFSEKYFWVLWDISSLIVILSAFLIINKNYTFKDDFRYKIIFLIGIFPFTLGNLFWLFLDLVPDQDNLWSFFEPYEFILIRLGAVLFSISLMVFPVLEIINRFNYFILCAISILTFKLILDFEYYLTDEYHKIEEDVSLAGAHEKYKENEELKKAFYAYPSPLYHAMAYFIYAIKFSFNSEGED
mgnify:FL=1